MGRDIDDEERRTAETAYILPAGHSFGDGFDDFEKSDEQKAYEQFSDEARESNTYAKLTVSRVPTNDRGQPKGRQLAFLFEASIIEMTYSQLLSRIRDEYGSGIYRIRVSDEAGKMKMNRNITIEAPKDAPGKVPAESMVGQISAALNESAERQERMLMRIMENRASGFDFQKALGYVAPIATALSTLGFKFNGKKEKSTTEFLQEIAAIKDILAPNENSGAGGDANIYTLLSGIVNNFGPALGEAIAMGQSRGQLNPDGSIRRQITGPKNPKQEKANDVEKSMEQIQPQLQFILMQAQMRNEPAEVANFIVDNIIESDKVSDDQINDILEFLKLEDCFVRCVSVVSEFEQYQEWFEAWRAAMIDELEALFDDTPEPLDEVPSGADMTNVGKENQPLTPDETAGQDDAANPAERTAPDVSQPDSDTHAHTAGWSGNESHPDDHAANRSPLEEKPAT